MLALFRTLASTAGQRSNLDRFVFHSQRLPRRVCRGTVGKTLRGFALKPPIAFEADRTVLVRDDPGHSTDQGLHSWRVARRCEVSGQLGTSTAVGFQAAAIVRENRALPRAETVRLHWASTAGPKARTADPSPDRECRRIKRAVPTGETALLNSYGGVTAALKRAVEEQPAAEGRSFQVVIDGERTGQ